MGSGNDKTSEKMEMWQKTSGEKKIDSKISKKGRRTKKRGGQGMEDLEMVKTEQWKNCEMGDYKKMRDPKRDGYKETEERWINDNRANQEE